MNKNLRPVPKNTNQPQQVSRSPIPVGGRPQPAQQTYQQPTQSFEKEDEFAQQHAPRMGAMPTMGFEEEFERDSSKEGKSKKLKMAIFGVLGAIILLGLVFVVMKLTDSGDPNKVSLLNGSTEAVSNNALVKTDSNNSTTATFDGNPVPVKWPSDVTPTRMEIQLDPISGEPIVMLIGDKSGLGTVIRSYNKGGNLTGYWVIVPDADTSTGIDTGVTAPAETEVPADAVDAVTEPTEPADTTGTE